MAGHGRRASGHGQRGAAAVEMAIVLPLLLLVIAGIIDLGRLLYTQVILTNAAREGARTAVVLSPYDPSKVTARVQTASGFTSPKLIVTPPVNCPAGGDATVALKYTFTWLILQDAMNMVKAGNVLPKDLSAKAVMRCGG